MSRGAREAHMSEEHDQSLLEDWAAWELKNAPELRPTAEMLRFLARRRNRGARRFAWGLALTAMAAGVSFLATLQPDLPSKRS